LEPIEWAFTILSFIAFYFFFGKKASQPSFRLKGFVLSVIISILMSIFCFSIGVLSIAIINIIYTFLNLIGIYNCYNESRSNTLKNSFSGLSDDVEKGIN